MTPPLSPGLIAQAACLLEVTARKPGNVHRFADFDDAHYLDFLLSAAAIARPLDRAIEVGVGRAVLEAVQATRQLVQTNTNLGMILLLAPLATVPVDVPIREGVAAVLESLTIDDARHVYQAIRLARPGGLGQAEAQDVREEPTVTLLEAMKLAADRDLVARQYAQAYTDVFERFLPTLQAFLNNGDPIETAIVAAFLRFLADQPDTLIARKRGMAVAREASARATEVFEAGWPRSLAGHAALDNFDQWLRADGHARNPGATADLATAGLFVALRDGTIKRPIGGVWSVD